MLNVSTQQLVDEWQYIVNRFGENIRQRVADLANAHQESLATHFYSQMLKHVVASQLLSHEQVQSRLSDSMKRWIVKVFAMAGGEGIESLVAQQMQIGEIHARIDVPVDMVLLGARRLKEKFHDLLLAEPALDAAQRLDAVRLTCDVIDLAMEIMSQAYSSSHTRNSRAAEAYRLFSVVQDASTERERQRAALLDWENQLMFDLAVGANAAQLNRIGVAEFGLWFHHKGAHAFQGTSETGQILESMAYIDDVLLPLFDLPGDSGSGERIQRVRDLRDRTKSIGFYLDSLFQQTHELEAGRDVLTRLLNRKFLPVVLGKEIGYARKKQSSFAVLGIDIDHFKQVNDTYGHEAGDMALQQMAVLLSNNSRGGDYIFRLGGEEFLMLLVDVDLAAAQRAAEKLRRQVAAESFRLSEERTLSLTISIGLALHTGHPDYQRLLRRVDEALYKAKHGGRNCIVLAES
jgi:diguanylate cyclase